MSTRRVIVPKVTPRKQVRVVRPATGRVQVPVAARRTIAPAVRTTIQAPKTKTHVTGSITKVKAPTVKRTTTKVSEVPPVKPQTTVTIQTTAPIVTGRRPVTNIDDGITLDTGRVDTFDVIDETQATDPGLEIDRIGLPFMTRFEYARVIGSRARQIELGDYPMIETDSFDPMVIAELELRAKALPMIIRRYFPNGEYEDWHVNELDPPRF